MDLDFLLNLIIVSSFVLIFDIISSFAFELEVPKIGISGKGLISQVTSKSASKQSPHLSVMILGSFMDIPQSMVADIIIQQIFLKFLDQ